MKEKEKKNRRKEENHYKEGEGTMTEFTPFGLRVYTGQWKHGLMNGNGFLEIDADCIGSLLSVYFFFSFSFIFLFLFHFSFLLPIFLFYEI